MLLRNEFLGAANVHQKLTKIKLLLLMLPLKQPVVFAGRLLLERRLLCHLLEQQSCCYWRTVVAPIGLLLLVNV